MPTEADFGVLLRAYREHGFDERASRSRVFVHGALHHGDPNYPPAFH
ncbi:hypothetical protein [Myxococcus sp. SDU36]|nr:hypothetical protein [Myxococcus sp. SDU36]WIG98787.1 hypothetical protein KGD87_16115 [Myxococcus sp. SDU36]